MGDDASVGGGAQDDASAREPDDDPEAEDVSITISAAATPFCAYKPGWLAPEDGHGCCITAERFLRVPVDLADVGGDGAYLPETRLPTDYIGHSFAPKQPPPAGWNPDGTHKDDVGERPQTYTVEELEAMQLERAGVAPPLPGMRVRMLPQLRPNGAQRYARVVACATRLPIDIRPTLRRRILDEVPTETEQERMERLLLSIDEAAEERGGLVEAQLAEVRRAGSCEELKALKHGTRGLPMSDIEVGVEYELIAVQIMGKSEDDPALTLFVRKEHDAHVVSFCVHNGICIALAREKRRLSSLFVASGDVRFWMHPSGEKTPIGTLMREESHATSVKAKRPAIVMRLAINTDDGDVVFHGDTTVAEPQPTEPMATDVAPSELDPPHTLVIHKDEFKTIPVLQKGVVEHDQCYKVLRRGDLVHYTNRTLLPMEVEDPAAIGGVRIVFGNARVVAIEKQIQEGTTLYIVGLLDKDAKVELMPTGAEWWVPAEHRYKNLPKISRGTMLPDATVVAAQRVPNGRRDNMVWMIKTADGLVYGFQQPNHAAKFALQQGVELNLHFNTTKWTME